MTDHKVQVTVKGGTAYDAPWVTFGGNDGGEVVGALQWFTGTQSADPATLTVEASTKLQNLWAVKDTLGGQVVQQQAAPVQQAAPAAPTGFSHQAAPQAAPAPVQPAQAAAPGPSCQHGPMTFRTGTGKNGRQWRAYFCSLPKGTPGGCDPQWLKD